MKAHSLKCVDDLEMIHQNAYQAERARARDSKGYSRYPEFRDFFDRQKVIDRLEGRTPEKHDILDPLREFYASKGGN